MLGPREGLHEVVSTGVESSGELEAGAWDVVGEGRGGKS